MLKADRNAVSVSLKAELISLRCSWHACLLITIMLRTVLPDVLQLQLLQPGLLAASLWDITVKQDALLCGW